VPSRSTTRGALAHGLKLGGDLLECAVRRGGGNAGDQPNQSVIAAPRRGTVHQARLDDAFRDQSPDGAPESLDRPVCRAAMVQDPCDIAPGLVRTHAPHGREPGVQPRQDAIQMGGVAAYPEFSNGIWIAGAQAGVATDAATRAPLSSQPWCARR
jgi:hypothetical protein